MVWNSKNNEVASNGNIYYTAENGIRYSLKDGKAIVVRQSTTISGAKVIPSQITYKGTTYRVTSIGEYAFYDCSSLISIEIPSSVTSIGKYAFYGCSSLTSIEIPISVTSIGHAAFHGCRSLTNIEIPSSVTSIGPYAFSYCSGLTSIEIPSSVTSIGYEAFRDCKHLIIYCVKISQPSGWSDNWNYSNCPVVWNSKNNEVASDGNIYY
ncbi:MAG: leucine-rich repeat domain-containing protein, partial [Clostridia bacterium]|nr:leucine-rich repeat domain-containing protein [Clostridia bacterium]